MTIHAAIRLGNLGFCLLSAALTGCIDEQIAPTPPLPSAVAKRIEFTDTNPGEKLTGVIKIAAAQDGQTDINQWTFDLYVFRWGVDGVPVSDNDRGAINYMGALNRGNERLEFELNETPPPGANSIIAYTSNSAGDAQHGISMHFDNLYVTQQNSVSTKGDDDVEKTTSGKSALTPYVARYAANNCCPFNQENPAEDQAENAHWSP